MEGYVKISLDNILDIKSRIKHVFDAFTPKYETRQENSYFGLTSTEVKVMINRPYWKSYEQHILNKLDDIIRMVKRKDEVNISLTCYNELCKLAEGDNKVNVTYILKY